MFVEFFKKTRRCLWMTMVYAIVISRLEIVQGGSNKSSLQCDLLQGSFVQYTVRSSLKQVDTAEGTEASLKLHKENNVVFTGQHVQKYFIDIPNKTKIGPDSGIDPCNSLNNRVTGLIPSILVVPTLRT